MFTVLIFSRFHYSSSGGLHFKCHTMTSIMGHPISLFFSCKRMTMDGGSWCCTGGSDQDHLQEKEMQKGKMVVWQGLTNSWEKKRGKGKGERERYTYLNAEFQRIARRDKKAFLSDQCKEIEENNRKTRDLFEKIRYSKGTFHAKMGSIKDRNGMDLTEGIRY